MTGLTLPPMPKVRLSAILYVLLMIHLLLGCHRPEVIRDTIRHGPLPSPPSESLRAEIEPVTIPSALGQPQVQFRVTPASGAWSGLGRGAGKGALYGCAALGWPAASGNILGVVFGVMGCTAGTIVGAVSGGVYGAVAAEPTETVEAATTTIRSALTNSEIQKKVQDQVREFITTHTTVPQVLREESVPGTSLELNVLSIELGKV